MAIKKDIENEVIEMLRRGTILPGDKLPSIRTMAKNFKVSITPVIDAYNELIAKHLVESRPNSGYYVVNSPAYIEEAMELQRQIHLNSNEHYSLIEDFLSGYSELVFNSNNDLQYYFGTTSASSLLYPELGYNASLMKALRRAEASGNYQVQLHDDVQLKKNLMKWMQPCQCKNRIDDISVVRSVTEGVMLAVRACARPGDYIAVEAPGHAGFYFIAKFLDCKIIPVPSHPGTGLDVKAFEKQLRRGARPSCLVLTSTFSNPTGALMPDKSKEQLCVLCAQHNIPIIEDDILGELYFTAERPRPLKSFDNENVIYVSGFGKCLNPTMRLGYVSAGRHSEAFAFQKHLATAYAYPMLQQGLVEFMESGIAYKHVSFFRKTLCIHVENYRETILACFPQGTRVEMPKGGPYLWVNLPDGMNSDLLCEEAKKYGISIAPSRLFNADESLKNCFRFNCVAMPFNSNSLMAVEKLGNLARSLCNRE